MMQALTTFKTPKGATIDLFAASAGRISVNANGKFVGMFAGLVDSAAAGGKAITLVGQATVIAVGAAVADVEAAVKAAAAAAEADAKDARARLAAYAQTPEGRIDIALTRIYRQQRED